MTADALADPAPQEAHPIAASYNAAYVDLLKRILINSIYGTGVDVTPADILSCTAALETLRTSKPWVLERYKSLTGASLAETLAYTKSSRALHTYVRRPGLDNIEACARDLLDNSVPGDFVDAGTLRGGTAILMRGILRAAGQSQRKVVVADSFEGLPRPCEHDSVFDREIWFAMADVLPQYNLLCIETLQRVTANFERYGLLDDLVEFVPGWFSQTLPALARRQIALIRVDADWYEGTRDVLVNLYPMLSAGGYVIIDDYKLEGCRRAVDEFRVRHRVFDKIRVADEEDGIVYWKKEATK